MGWFSNYFDTDFKGEHKEGDTYSSNIEYDADPKDISILGQFTLSIYRIRGGKMGKAPIYRKTVDLTYGNPKSKRQIERELERESDEFVRSQTGVHDS